MSRYIPPSQRPKSPPKTCPKSKSQSQTYPKIGINIKRKFKYNVLHNLNNQIEENIKYNHYLDGTLTDKLNIIIPHTTGPNTALSPDETPHKHPKKTSSFADPNTPILAPKTIPYDYNNIDDEDENLSHQNDKKLIKKFGITPNPSDVTPQPSNAQLPNTALSPDETAHTHPKETSSFVDPNTPILAPKTIPYDQNNIDDENENLSYEKLIKKFGITPNPSDVTSKPSNAQPNGKHPTTVFANAKHLNYALKNPIETSPQLSHPTITNDINGAATSKAISSKNYATKVHVTISVSTASKTLPRGHNEIDDTDQNISHQIDEKIDIKYATLTPKDYAFLRAFTHVINAPISTPMTIIHTATHGTLLLHSDDIKLDEKSDKETSTFNQSLSNIKPTLTPNNYILNGKNENILASTLILLIISAVLIQYTNGITIKKVNL